MNPLIEFDPAVPEGRREFCARLLRTDRFLRATLWNVLGARSVPALRVRPLVGHGHNNKALYRVDTEAGPFVLKHALRRGFLWLHPRGTFKWREVTRLKALQGTGVTPCFGADLALDGYDAYTEELIEGVTGAEVDDPARTRQLACMWLTISRLLGRVGPFWRAPGSAMAPGNAMFPRGGRPPVVVDIGTARWRTPGRIVRKLVRCHGHTDAVLDGIEDALGGPKARRFFRIARRQVGDPALAETLRLRG